MTTPTAGAPGVASGDPAANLAPTPTATPGTAAEPGTDSTASVGALASAPVALPAERSARGAAAAPRAGKTAPRRHPPRPLIALALLGALAAGLYAWYTGHGQAADTALRASGTVESEEVVIAPETAGRVVGIYAREGDRVQRGQVLVQLDDSLLQLQYRQAPATDLRRLELELDRLKLRSPVDGRVGERSLRIGEVAQPGQTILTVMPLDELELTLYVLERDLGRVRVGQPVLITADPYPGERFTGWVTSIASRAEFTPRTVQTPKDRVNLVFAVRVRLPNPDERLKPGLPVDAVFLDGEG